MTTHAAVYARLSPRPDNSYEGVEDQVSWGRTYAAKAWPGLTVEVFADAGISAAKDGVTRPEYERLREWLAAGRIAQVWTVEQSRLERREVGWFTLAAELDAAGISEVHTNRDGIVRVRDEVASIKAVLAAAEVRKLTRRVNDKLSAKAARGEPPAVRPFGYRHTTKLIDGERVKTYAIVERQAAAIREAADKVLAGWSLAHIAAELDARGLRGRSGGRIAATTVKRWLTAPTIAGIRVHKGEQIGEGNWPPILDRSVWQRVNAKLAASRVVMRSDGGTYPVSEAHKGNPVGRRYVLTGLAHCGVCRHQLVGSQKQLRHGRRHGYLLCHPTKGGRGCVGIMLPETEAYVLGEIFDRLDRPEFLASITQDTHAAERDALVAQLAAVETQRGQLAAEWAQGGGLTLSEWQAARQGLAAREKALRGQLAAVPEPVEGIDLAHARQAWSSMTLDEQREFVRIFVAAVIVNRAVPGTKGYDPGRVTIEWREL